MARIVRVEHGKQGRVEIRLTPLLKKDRRFKAYLMLFPVFAVFLVLAMVTLPAPATTGVPSFEVSKNLGSSSKYTFPYGLNLSSGSYFNLSYSLHNSSYLKYTVYEEPVSFLGSGKQQEVQHGNVTGNGAVSFYNNRSSEHVVYSITLVSANTSAEDYLNISATSYYPVLFNPTFAALALVFLGTASVATAMRITTVYRKGVELATRNKNSGMMESAEDSHVEPVRIDPDSQYQLRPVYLLLPGVILMAVSLAMSAFNFLPVLSIILLPIGGMLFAFSFLIWRIMKYRD